VHMRTFLNSIHGENIPPSGRLSSWKKLIRGQLIYERLDRVVGRKDWLDLYPNCSVVHGPFSCSDHSYIFLSTNNSTQFHKGPKFQFQNHWSSYDEVHKIVKTH